MKTIKVVILLMALVALLIAGCTSAATLPPADKPAPTPAANTPPPPTQAAAAPAKADSPWQVVLEKEVKQSLSRAAFLNENFGLTGGYYNIVLAGGADTTGKVQYTTDGGKMWTMADTTTGGVASLDIVDAQTVWQCNVSYTSVSGDGGKTWENISPGDGSCVLSAADAKIAWAIRLPRGVLQLTTDRGKTWKKMVLPNNLKEFETISLRTASEGYMLTADGVVHKTQDGGKTWSSSATLDMTKYGKMTFLPVGDHPGCLPSSVIRFFDADHGLVIMSLLGGGGSKVVALRTADGGQAWTEEAVPAPTGAFHLTHDGKYLTVIPTLKPQKIIVLRYTGG
jgi:photosystem II stability/assembly factor-like uncharacterized protein